MQQWMFETSNKLYGNHTHWFWIFSRPLKFPSPENIDSITSLMRLIVCGMNKGFPYFHGSLWDFHGNGHIPQLMAVFMWFLGPFPAWCIQVSSAWRSACGERSYQVGGWYLKIVGKITQIHWLMMIFLVKKRELHPMGEWFFSKKSVKTLTIMALWRDQAKPNEGNCGNCDGNLYGPFWMIKNRETSDQSWLIPSYSWEGCMKYYWTMGQNGLHCAKSFHSNDVCRYMCASAW